MDITDNQVERISSEFLQRGRHTHNAAAAQILRVLKNESHKRNTLTLDEFRHFAPIFDTKVVARLSKDEADELGAEWANRIDPYEEVHIVESLTDEKPLFILPALYTRVPAINVVGQAGLVASEGFTKYANDDNIASDKPSRYTDLYIRVLDQVNRMARPYYEARQRRFEETMEDLKKKKVLSSDASSPEVKTAPPPQQASTIEFEEEYL